MNFINRHLKTPDSLFLAKKELERSRKAFLEAKTHTEYYAALTEFESVRIARLDKYIKDAEKVK
jgi:hypothetical protein